MNELTVLCATAATVGIVHTVLGPDHYLPFVAMAQARGWSTAKTATITGVCGIGHVLGSVVLGFFGIAFEKGLAYFRQKLVSVVLVVILYPPFRTRAAAPETMLIELDALNCNTPIHHRPNKTIAQRQSVFLPCLVGIWLICPIWVFGLP